MYHAKKAWKKYKAEIVLLGLGVCTTLLSIGLYFQTDASVSSAPVLAQQVSPSADPAVKEAPFIYVDISGSVKAPNMYAATPGARLKHILEQAGGLSDEADYHYFSLNFNTAKILQDQEKIYIPSTIEVLNGFNNNFLSTSTDTTSQSNSDEKNSTTLNINTASLDELDQLPGIGKVTAEKIIENRPFDSLDQLTELKIVNNSTFEKIKDLIVAE